MLSVLYSLDFHVQALVPQPLNVYECNAVSCWTTIVAEGVYIREIARLQGQASNASVLIVLIKCLDFRGS